MKKWLLAAVLALLPTFANATCSGVFKPGTLCGNNSGVPSVPFEIPSSTNLSGPGSSTVGDIVIWNNTAGTLLGDKAPQPFNTANDSNVTITLTGSPAISLFNPVLATMGWIGQLPVARGGTGISTGTSGGIPYFSSTSTMASSGLLNSLILGNGAGAAPTNYAGTSCTAQFIRAFGTTGIATCASVNLTSDVINALPVANGGTGANTQSGAAIDVLPVPTRAGDILYWNGSIWSTVAGNNSGTQVLQENSSGVPSWVTITGTGTVTSITPGSGIVSAVNTGYSQTAITSAGTVSLAEATNQQTGTTYTFVDGDRAKLVTGTNALAQAYSLPAAGSAAGTTFVNGWWIDLQNRGAGIMTVTPTTSTIDGATSLVLPTGQGVRLVSDGTNYFTERGAPSLQSITNSLGADVGLGNVGSLFTGPQVAQGTIGTWYASGTVTLTDTASGAFILCVLWDGTTVVASAGTNTNGASSLNSLSLSGVIASPAANIRISCRDTTTTNGKMLFNVTGQSHDSTITAIRLQ